MQNVYITGAQIAAAAANAKRDFELAQAKAAAVAAKTAEIAALAAAIPTLTDEIGPCEDIINSLTLKPKQLHWQRLSSRVRKPPVWHNDYRVVVE
jgi:hypothetical protein